ncbi:glycoside hydrolase family 18 protein [Amycolatopsis samaneae]|uniref:chitinase n=1 Tax=Amycolatopsis samaneae TaxID=664691 RepID=A0ABW5GVI6_9PSEU
MKLTWGRARRAGIAFGAAVLTVLSLVPASASAEADAAAETAARKQPVLEAFWGGSPSADQVPWEMVNTISYFFASPAGGHCDKPNDKQRNDILSLQAVKRTHPGLTVLVSIGGWAAPGFSAGAATAESRRAFVSSCVDNWVRSFPAGLVDGLDVDWEFPVYGGLPEIGSSPADKENLNHLLVEFRQQMNRYAHQVGRRQPMKLSIDVPAGRRQDDGTGKGGAPYDQSKSFDLRTVGRLVDIFNLMTYDLCTGYATVSCFNDPLVKRPDDPNDKYNNDTGALEYMKAHGVPEHKIVLGVPFYGRSYTVTSDKNGGLYQPYTATEFLNYKDLVGPKWIGNPDFVQGWDPVVRSPYLWNAKTKTWVNFANPRSIQDRSRFARNNGLQGMMMWEIGLDDPQHSLLAAMTGPWLDR